MTDLILNANAMAQCSPSDIEELTAQVVDATTSTNQMTDELVQLNNALIELISSSPVVTQPEHPLPIKRSVNCLSISSWCCIALTHFLKVSKVIIIYLQIYTLNL